MEIFLTLVSEVIWCQALTGVRERPLGGWDLGYSLRLQQGRFRIFCYLCPYLILREQTFSMGVLLEAQQISWCKLGYPDYALYGTCWGFSYISDFQARICCCCLTQATVKYFILKLESLILRGVLWSFLFCWDPLSWYPSPLLVGSDLQFEKK